MRMLMIAALVLFAATGGANAQTSPGQSFPNKPVRIIVPFPAGGGIDIVARILAPKLTEEWKQQVIVENRAGAAGVIGTEATARSAPDGHTMVLASLGNLAVNQHLYKMSIDPTKDLAPVTLVVNVHFALFANPSFPPNNVAELVALAKAKPGQINFSSSGAGGAPHLAGELFRNLGGVDIVHVPYKGSAPSVQDLVAGQVQITFDSLVQVLPLVKGGQVKALAVLGKNRSPLLPQVPTVDQSGLPGYDLTNWFGFAVPSATPKDILSKIHVDVAKLLKTPEIREKFAEMGADTVGNTPEEFGALIRADSEKWGKLIREAKIRAEN